MTVFKNKYFFTSIKGRYSSETTSKIILLDYLFN